MIESKEEEQKITTKTDNNIKTNIMKLQIDTILKTVKLDEQANISSFINCLKELLPVTWTEYTLISNSTIHWTYAPYTPWTTIPCNTWVTASANGITTKTNPIYTISNTLAHTTLTNTNDAGMGTTLTNMETLGGNYNVELKA